MKNKDIKQRAREMFEEQMADLEHDRWAGWQEYFFGKCEIQNPEDGYIYMKLPTDLYERWKRQIEQSYLELSEKEKENDRLEVRKYYPFIDQIIDLAITEERKRVVNIKYFIQSEIDRAIAKEKERIERNLKQYGYYEYYEKMNMEIAQNQSQFNKLITKQ